MAFINAFLWGTGLSLGMCVGLVAWMFLRTASSKVLGISEQWTSSLQLQRESVEALKLRNILTADTNEFAERIALVLERYGKLYEAKA